MLKIKKILLHRKMRITQFIELITFIYVVIVVKLFKSELEKAL